METIGEFKEEANKKDGVWPVLPEAGDDDPDDIIAGNSLDGGSTGRHGKFFDLKQGKSRPLDSWTREESQDVVGNEDDSLFNGPLYSDQEQVTVNQLNFFFFYILLFLRRFHSNLAIIDDIIRLRKFMLLKMTK